MLRTHGRGWAGVLLGLAAALWGSGCGTSLPPTPEPNPGPSADAGPSMLEVQTGAARTVSVLLDASGTVAGDSPIASYSWIESDRVIATGLTASVELGTGSHVISLLVTDMTGAQDTDEITVLVSSPPRSEYELTIAVVGKGQVSPAVGTTIHPAGAPVSVRYELRDFDGVRFGLLDRFELVGAEQDVLALGELITLHHVFAGDDHVVLGADVLLLHACATRLVHHVEGDAGLGFGRGI